jgi:hypothetical protein
MATQLVELKSDYRSLCTQSWLLRRHLGQLYFRENLWLISSILKDLQQVEREKQALISRIVRFRRSTL